MASVINDELREVAQQPSFKPFQPRSPADQAKLLALQQKWSGANNPSPQPPKPRATSKRLNDNAPRPRRLEALPLSLPPRGLRREEAAAYVGVGVSLFDQMVADGRMPKPKRINGAVVWDRLALDRAFDALPGGDDAESKDPYGSFAA
jgi:predicted DNA-binding transcriptional regulator AlpA